MTPRKYALTKIGNSDYVCPSNDGKTLWRFNRYDEDGSLERPDGKGGWRVVLGSFWMVQRAPLPSGGVIDPDELEWEYFDSTLRTRRAAIEVMERAQ